MWSHFDFLHPAARQQHHLQVEQVGRQVAGGLGDVEAHSGEERGRRWEEMCARKKHQALCEH